MMKITVLGCGHSGGTPMIGEGWGKCDPTNPKNRRTRPSILVETENTRILVDTSPDIRQQLLAADVSQVDAVLFTHAHADHLHGIDDLRAVNRAMNAWIPAYTDVHTWDQIEHRFGYVTEPLRESATFFYKPCLTRHDLNAGDSFTVGNISISALEQDHGYGSTLGFRFGDFAYSTDVVDMPDDTFTALEGVHTWMVGAFWEKEHPTHAHVAKTLDWFKRVGPEKMYLTHLSHQLDYDQTTGQLPAGAALSYDGMVFEVYGDK